MFDSLGPEGLAAADDAAVVDGVAGWCRAEAASAARRLAAIGELVDRQCGEEVDADADGRVLWSCDLWDVTAAQVGAALGISARRASSQMYLARSLRERLPRVNAVFLQGWIGARLVSTISWRTHLVVDEAAMAAIDAALAEMAQAWGPLSDAKVEQAIDALVERHDPQGREWFEQARLGLGVQFGKPDDASGTRSVWGRVASVHAELIERRLAVMARGVCAGDPRSMGQRRADAVGAVFAGADRISCLCGAKDCPNAGVGELRGSVVVHVVADQGAVDAARGTASGPKGAGPAGNDGSVTPDAGDEPDAPEVGDEIDEGPGRDQPGPQETPVRPAAHSPAAATPDRPPVAVMADGSVVPTALLAQLLATGATLARLAAPCGEPESGYRPSAGLARFVRSRDMTCRFPGCSVPAEDCDLDHAIPYPLGPTHASDLRAMCRKHHLVKTFYDGPDGWSDRQYPDGRIEWRSPTGHTYTTFPGAWMFFPGWDTTTAQLPDPPADAVRPANRGVQMPKRRRTRAADQAQRIKSRRAHHDTS